MVYSNALLAYPGKPLFYLIPIPLEFQHYPPPILSYIGPANAGSNIEPVPQVVDYGLGDQLRREGEHHPALIHSLFLLDCQQWIIVLAKPLFLVLLKGG